MIPEYDCWVVIDLLRKQCPVFGANKVPVILSKEAKEQPVVRDSANRQFCLRDESDEAARDEVRERIGFGVSPDQLRRVEFGCVGKRQVSARPAPRQREEALARFASVRVEPIPDKLNVHAQAAQQGQAGINERGELAGEGGENLRLHAATADRRLGATAATGADGRLLRVRAPATRRPCGGDEGEEGG